MQKLEQRAKKCIELRGEYVESIPSLVAVACFLPGRSKDLQAPPRERGDKTVYSNYRGISLLFKHIRTLNQYHTVKGHAMVHSKSFGVINVDLDITGQIHTHTHTLSLSLSAFVTYLERNRNTTRKCIHYLLKTSRNSGIREVLYHILTTFCVPKKTITLTKVCSNDMTYLLTAIWLISGGSRRVPTYTQIYKTTECNRIPEQNINNNKNTEHNKNI